jgi:predicted DNA-binding transcriptional regulator YafY
VQKRRTHSRFLRVIRLVIFFQTGQVADCAALSKQFRVSRRTIFRDLELISEAGYTLSFKPELGGYRLVDVPSLEAGTNGKSSPIGG